jgi:HD-GYP domain-containing protein (c-di-GMP phosphodiesterase class II)
MAVSGLRRAFVSDEESMVNEDRVEPRRRLDPYLLGDGFLDRLTEGVLLINAEGLVVDCNARAATILDSQVDVLLGRGLADTDWRFVREDGSDLPLSENPVLQTLESRQGTSDRLIGMDAPGRARRWGLVSTAPLVHGDELKGIIATLEDVTAVKLESKRLRLLLEVSRRLTAVEEESEFFQGLCDTLVDVGGYAVARVDRANPDDEQSVTRLFGAGFASYLEGGPFTWSEMVWDGECPCGEAVRTQRTQVVNDLATYQEHEAWRRAALDLGVASSIALPFTVAGETYLLSVYDRFAGAFDDATVQGLEEIAREAEFGASYLRSIEEIETALSGTISALSHMTETRDPYTAGHQSHVGSLGEQIAAKMGLDSATVDLIRQSGDLHDVGKIAIPLEILTKPGRLSAEEFALVKQHPAVGAEILTKASLPWPIADVALQHHERLDGSGYPAGLVGEEICLPARIIAVADVVEAMSQHRPYRPALGVGAALDEVRRGAGTLFDEGAVAACLAVFDDGFTFSGPESAGTDGPGGALFRL